MYWPLFLPNLRFVRLENLHRTKRQSLFATYSMILNFSWRANYESIIQISPLFIIGTLHK